MNGLHHEKQPGINHIMVAVYKLVSYSNLLERRSYAWDVVALSHTSSGEVGSSVVFVLLPLPIHPPILALVNGGTFEEG